MDYCYNYIMSLLITLLDLLLELMINLIIIFNNNENHSNYAGLLIIMLYIMLAIIMLASNLCNPMVSAVMVLYCTVNWPDPKTLCRTILFHIKTMWKVVTASKFYLASIFYSVIHCNIFFHQLSVTLSFLQ